MTDQSFGKYFDDQHDRIIKAMQNKNTELNIAWREDYDKRQAKKQEMKNTHGRVFSTTNRRKKT